MKTTQMLFGIQIHHTYANSVGPDQKVQEPSDLSISAVKTHFVLGHGGYEKNSDLFEFEYW